MISIIRNTIYILLLLIIVLIILGISIKYYRINKIKNDKTLYIKDITIPKNIFLCYKTKNVPSYIISNWKTLNPDYNIFLYDNNDCMDFLLKYFGQEYVDCFNYIQDGPIKADFWRICILYIYGGVYSDIDVEMLVSIDSIIELSNNNHSNVSFITCNSISFFSINPHLIITVPKHHVLKRCIEKYIEFYRDKKTYSYWGWSIVTIMKYVIYVDILNTLLIKDTIYIGNDNNKYMFIKEEGDTNKIKEIYCSYNKKKILNNRYNSYDPFNHHFI